MVTRTTVETNPLVQSCLAGQDARHLYIAIGVHPYAGPRQRTEGGRVERREGGRGDVIRGKKKEVTSTKMV